MTTETIASDIDAMASLAADDGMLAQRLVGAAAALRSAAAGDGLNNPPPTLPDDWAPDSIGAAARTTLAERMLTAATELDRLQCDGAATTIVVGCQTALRTYAAALSRG